MSVDKVIRRADPSSIQNKVLVGYQGWFTCAGDGPPVHHGHHGWLHWFDKPLTEGGHPNFDLFPDVSEYSPEELYPTPGLSYPSPNGQYQPAKLFSSRNPRTVQRHFHWMARHGIDGAFLQRFATQCEVDGNQFGPTADIMRLRDEVLDRVREAAEQENRVWAIMYDVTGLSPDRVEHVLRVDWDHLVRNKRILDSPYYLKERGSPVVAIWGFGFVEARHDPQMVVNIVRHIKTVTPGGAYVWGGVPSQWRTLTGDMDSNPAFLDVFKNEFDALSPWTVGRYNSQESMDWFFEFNTQGDIKDLKDLSKRVDYVPTIWPGGSSFNMTSGRLRLNDAPRDGGKFFWRQLWSVKHMGARTLYVAMFDEYDEGTAVLPAIPLKRSLPRCDDSNCQYPFIALDADGIDNLSPDWYLRICGFASEIMKDEKRVYEELPKKELDDYWALRPKYEASNQGYAAVSSVATVSSSTTTASGSGNSQPFEAAASSSVRPPVRQNTGAWGNLIGGADEPAPPPYSLEASEEAEPSPASAASNTVPTTPAALSATPTPVASNGPPSPTMLPYASGGAAGVHRSSSYGPSSATGSSVAAGLGRSSTYSATSLIPNSHQPPATTASSPSSVSATSTPTSPPSSLRPPPRFAPPATPPPGSSAPPQASVPLNRPPVHPSSPLASQGPASTVGSYTPPAGQSPHTRPVGLSTGVTPSSSTTNLHHDFTHAMNLGPSGSGPSTPILSTAAVSSHTSSYVSATHSHGSPSQPGHGVVSPSGYPYVATPGHPVGSSSLPTSSNFHPFPVATSPPVHHGSSLHNSSPFPHPFPGGNGPAPPSASNQNHFNSAHGLPHGSGQASHSTNMPTPAWSAPSAPPPPMPAVGTSSYPSTPGPTQPIPPPMQGGSWTAPTTGPAVAYPSNTYGSNQPGSSQSSSSPCGSSTYGASQPGPSQSSSSPCGSSPYGPSQPGPSQGSNSPYGSSTSFPSPGQPSTSNPYTPPLPPRPGEPGSVTPPKDNTFMGGFVHKASGMVGKYAGEGTRLQVEKAAQAGSKLLGLNKYTK